MIALDITYYLGKNMKHIKSAVFVVALGSISVQANAGIWDSITSFFGGSEAETVSAPASESTGGIVSTGLALLPLLTQQLGVSGDQASGGMGALLQAAQALMPNSQFSQVTQAIPSASSLLSAAPEVSSDSGSLTDTVLKMAAEQSETVKAGTQLVSQFKSLGMGVDMIPKFTGVAESFLQQSSEPSTANLLSTALSSMAL